jgi:hypothetical protein
LPEHAGGQFVREATIGLPEVAQGGSKRLIEGLAVLYAAEDPIGREARLEPRGHLIAHSSIPLDGLEGTATSRRGIRPAR